MGNFTISQMFENPRRGRQTRNFTTNASKILDRKSSSEQMFFRKLSLGVPEGCLQRRFRYGAFNQDQGHQRVGTQMVEVEPVRDIHSNLFSDVRCNSIHLLLNLQHMSKRILQQKTDGKRFAGHSMLSHASGIAKSL